MTSGRPGLLLLAFGLVATEATGCGGSPGPEPFTSDDSLLETATPPCRPLDVRARLDIGYSLVPHPSRRLDLYAPERPPGCPPAPVVVWIHGGGWNSGSRSGKGIADKIDFFARREGYLFVSIDYRLSPDPPNPFDPSRLTFPAHPRDVGDALRWVRAHATEYGGDPSAIAVLGHSAGAHLAALVGTDAGYAGARTFDSLRCIGSYDTQAYDIPRTMASRSFEQAVLYINAFTADPQAWSSGSPITHVSCSSTLPAAFQLVLRGTPENMEGTLAFADALATHGVVVDTIDARELSHEEVNTSIGKREDTVMTPAIRAFLQGCFAGAEGND